MEQNEFDVRRNKLDALTASGEVPFKYTYKIDCPISDILNNYAHISADDNVEKEYSVAGRMIARRGHGKAMFANLLDQNAKVQLYVKKDILGDEAFAFFENLDIGDILGIKGTPFRTHKGELSLRVNSFTLLTKSLHPLPEKFHGLTDKEMRYRKRYVDLIANPDIRTTFHSRSRIISYIRRTLENLNFIEVETPILNVIAGGATARPFITYHNALDMELYMRIAPELYLKRIIVGGFERVFEIGRVFRNEGISYKHNPEYTLMELYQAYADYHDIMHLTETLIAGAINEIKGTTKIQYQGVDLDFTPPFNKLTMAQAVSQYTGIDINLPLPELRAAARAKKLEIEDHLSKGQILNKIYDELVEHHLIQPTFIMDYPIETSPLAKKKRDDDTLVERFELIVNGMEIANAFSELNDPIDQKARFAEQVKEREAGDEEAQQMDLNYVEALEYGLPPTGGLGIGIDRVVMLATDSASIRDVIFFPHMRNKETD